MKQNLSWKDILKEEKEKKYFKEVLAFQKKERDLGKNIYPSQERIFEAFKLTDFENIKIVILGQDPYHGQNQAMGLAFSVFETQNIPPSLQNIYKEIIRDYEKKGLKVNYLKNGNLEKWAKQGVFLLNSVLTVEEGKPGSHSGKGWEEFTDFVIKKISEEKENVIFMLWGNFAFGKIPLINPQKHIILKAPHPSPLSAHRGFIGCGHFGKANQILKERGESEIIWL